MLGANKFVSDLGVPPGTTQAKQLNNTAEIFDRHPRGVQKLAMKPPKSKKNRSGDLPAKTPMKTMWAKEVKLK